MDEKSRIDFRETLFKAAMEAKESLGDMKNYVESLRENFSDRLGNFSDLDVAFMAGHIIANNDMAEDLREKIKEVNEFMCKKMPVIRDVGKV